MIRESQVEKIKDAVRAFDQATRTGSRKEQQRCLAVMEAVCRNSSKAELNAAIRS